MTTKAIEFAETGEAARISYSIPMPGAHTGRRITEIELDLSPTFTSQATTLGTQLADILGAQGAELDEALVERYLSRELETYYSDTPFMLPAGPSTTEADPNGLPDPNPDPAALSAPSTPMSLTPLTPPMDSPISAPSLAIIPETNLTPTPRLSTTTALTVAGFMSNLAFETVRVPVRDWAGVVRLADRPLKVQSVPRFFIVEEYGISSFLGDYGMGRTIKTFTLLPGESTTISLKTWQTSKESRKESSSIIDSHQQAARERFTNKVKSETTDKATKKKAEKWHAEAEVNVSWGFGSAKVKGGGGGEYHSGREQFAKRAAAAVQDHASEASAKRELSVTSNSERTMESGEESVIERTISNVNKRRVLNFVFRELNQTYTTKLHLKEIRVAFANGLIDSWREVPLSGLRPMLEEVLAPNLVDLAASQIIRAMAHVYNDKDLAVPVLDQVRLRQDGSGADVISPAPKDASGDYVAPIDDMYYRFRSGALEQKDHSNPVDGVLLDERKIVMRTDSVVVEALLGQADALDNYAMEIQEAAAEKESLANQRDRIILAALEQIDDPEKRAELGVAFLKANQSDSSESTDDET